ncbi:dihydroorotase [Lichenifustis flavocetrariae]|uniref:Dihydroorotase n=1 Tax=Lichenifustis flavocetrariae TaxID=2949735 RepID=A0AA41YTA5_9HYPH|nr:dihydroorotase [Lichenifustis flavocetrariae]MCW6506821.1 dihydroorotase [Lichenifustis flavocetrariae]
MSVHALSPAPLALVNARLIDPEQLTEARGGVLVRDGVIMALGAGVSAGALPGDVKVVDCHGDCVSPGLIDLRAFVGEPGAEHRETIATATAAAAAGGITTMLAMPNTDPPIDDPAVVDFLLRRARDTGRIKVLSAATLTRKAAGHELSEVGLLQAAGAVAFTDGLHSVADARVMRRALTYARDFSALVMHFCEDASLADGGVMNEGELASRLGLTGIPREAETIVLERDLRLVALTGARYHAAVVSSSQSLALIARAKADGLPVTCSTTINHLTLNESDIGDYRTFLKLSPPLRGEDERLSLVEGLRDGVIDTIVSDHNPQDVETKRLPFAEAAPGAIGLETLLSAALRLFHAGQVGLPDLMAALTCKPALILGLPQGRLAVGAPADLIRFDPDEPFVLDTNSLRSRCRNTPFDGSRMEGRVKLTLVDGRVAFEEQGILRG